MPTFYYLAVGNADNRKIYGETEAENESAARRELNRLGMSVLTVATHPLAPAAATGQRSFEFEARDKDGKDVSGTIEASSDEQAYDRLIAEFGFTVNYLCLANATSAEKAAARASGLAAILAVKEQRAAQEEARKKSLVGRLESLVKAEEKPDAAVEEAVLDVAAPRKKSALSLEDEEEEGAGSTAKTAAEQPATDAQAATEPAAADAANDAPKKLKLADESTAPTAASPTPAVLPAATITAAPVAKFGVGMNFGVQLGGLGARLAGVQKWFAKTFETETADAPKVATAAATPAAQKTSTAGRDFGALWRQWRAKFAAKKTASPAVEKVEAVAPASTPAAADEPAKMAVAAPAVSPPVVAKVEVAAPAAVAEQTPQPEVAATKSVAEQLAAPAAEQPVATAAADQMAKTEAAAVAPIESAEPPLPFAEQLWQLVGLAFSTLTGLYLTYILIAFIALKQDFGVVSVLARATLQENQFVLFCGLAALLTWLVLLLRPHLTPPRTLSFGLVCLFVVFTLLITGINVL